jgi:nucleoside triphosphate diphosphatase
MLGPMAGIDELLRIMARLRDPARGCPWDLAQDFASISPHTIEEAYEVDEAIASGDLSALRDELGDLLFQVVFQARLAQEQGAFDFEGVVDSVCEKLIRRHPHIFAGAPSPESASAQVANWEAIKATERAAAAPDDGSPPDPFAGIPRALPALMRSAKIAGRLARTGDSGTAAGGAADSDAGGPAAGGPSRAERLALVGEGIRAWVELARQLGVDPEQALRLRDDEAIAAARRDVHQAGNGRHR